MSTATPRTVVTARIATADVEQLRELAEQRDSTVSRLVARAVKEYASKAGRNEPHA